MSEATNPLPPIDSATSHYHGQRFGQTHRSISLTLHPLRSDRHSLAQQNAETIKNMNLGMLLTGALSLMLRILLRKGTLSPARISFWLLVLSYVPSIFLSRYLERIGSPKRDPTTGTLISSGEDLGRPGVIEYAFDVIYITCASSPTYVQYQPNVTSFVFKGHARLAVVYLVNGSGSSISSSVHCPYVTSEPSS